MDPATELASLIVNFDEDNPGDEEADLVIPFPVWVEWFDLASQIVHSQQAREEQ